MPHRTPHERPRSLITYRNHQHRGASSMRRNPTNWAEHAEKLSRNGFTAAQIAANLETTLRNRKNKTARLLLGDHDQDLRAAAIEWRGRANRDLATAYGDAAMPREVMAAYDRLFGEGTRP